MLDLVFRNNQAPALNSDNMNRIVNAINENDNKSKELTDEILATNNKINEIMAEKIPEEVISAEVNAYIQEHNSNLAFSKDVANNWNGNGYNLIPFPYYDGMSKVTNGITYTVNADGSITVNGTATANSFFFIHENEDTIGTLNLDTDKSYRLSGNPLQNNDNSVMISNATNRYIDKGQGVIFKPYVSTLSFKIRIAQGTTVNNITIKPMLTEVNADGTYPTEYQRYASGNVELTDNKADSSIITEKFNATKSYVEGDYLIYNDTLYKVKVNCSGIVPPDTTYYEAVTVASEVTQLKTSLMYVEETKVVDGITWKIRKYDNGIAEMWGDFTLNGTWVAWGSLFVLRNANTMIYALPISLVKKLQDVDTPMGADTSANAFWSITYSEYNSMDNNTSCDIARATAGTNNVNYYVRKYVQGRWK